MRHARLLSSHGRSARRAPKYSLPLPDSARQPTLCLCLDGKAPRQAVHQTRHENKNEQSMHLFVSLALTLTHSHSRTHVAATSLHPAMVALASFVAASSVLTLVSAHLGCGGHHVNRRNLGGPLKTFVSRQSPPTDEQSAAVSIGQWQCLPHAAPTTRADPDLRPRPGMHTVLISTCARSQTQLPHHLADRVHPPQRRGRAIRLCRHQRHAQPESPDRPPQGHRRR